MNIRPIHTDIDHQKALKEIEGLWNAKEGTEDFDRLDILATLVDAYERKTWPMARPNPIEALLFRMEQLGITRKGLEAILGVGSGRVSEMLTGRRALSLAMIRALHEKLGVPAEVLIAKFESKAPRGTKGTALRPPFAVKQTKHGKKKRGASRASPRAEYHTT